MDNLIHTDNPEDDTEEQRVIRHFAEVPPRTGDGGPIHMIDLELVLARMKSRKNPGPDNINPEMVKKGWTHLGPQLFDLFNAYLRHAVSPII